MCISGLRMTSSLFSDGDNRSVASLDVFDDPLVTAGNTIAIGTTHGYILLFDSKQLLSFFLQPSEEVGGISALCFNVDSNRLLAGHDRGVVNMWDTENGKILRVVKDIIGSAVLHVKFTDDPTKAIMSNGTGCNGT